MKIFANYILNFHKFRDSSTLYHSRFQFPKYSLIPLIAYIKYDGFSVLFFSLSITRRFPREGQKLKFQQF